MATNRLTVPSGGRTLHRREFLRHTGMLGGMLLAGGIVSACGTADTPDTDPDEAAPEPADVGQGLTIGLSLNGVVEYTQCLATGVLQALEGTQYDFLAIQANFDVATELGNIEQLIAQGIDGLVVLPVSADSAAQGARLASEAGIPVGHALWPGESPADEHFVGVAALDSVRGGELIGEWLVENAEPGKVLVVQGIVGQGFSERIDEGLDRALGGTDFQIVHREQGFFDRATAIGIVENTLQAHPDLAVIVDYAATMSNGISAFQQDHGHDDIVHVTSDADDEMVDWIKTPYLTAARYYSSAQTGLVAAEAVREALETGEAASFERDVFQDMATEENIDEFVAEYPYCYHDHMDRVETI